jgi:hypothetical protein
VIRKVHTDNVGVYEVRKVEVRKVWAEINLAGHRPALPGRK